MKKSHRLVPGSSRTRVAVAALAFMSASAASAAHAATINVSTEAQLQSAIAQAEANPSDHYYINLAARTGGYVLTKPLKFTKANVVVTGNLSDPAKYVLDGQDKFRIFDVRAAAGFFPSLTIQGVVMQRGKSPGSIGADAVGGALALTNVSTLINYSVVKNSRAEGYGAGIYAAGGSLDMDYVLIEGNRGFNVGNKDIGGTIANSCGGGNFTNGGGIVLLGGVSATLTHATIKGNKHCRWGGVAVSGSSLWMENVTITQNEGVSNGGGLVIQGNSHVTVRFSTIRENKVGTKGTTEQKHGAGIAVLAGFQGSLKLIGSASAGNNNYNGNPTGTPTKDDYYTGTPRTCNHDANGNFVCSYQVKNWKNIFAAVGSASTGDVAGDWHGSPSSPYRVSFSALSSGNGKPSFTTLALPTYKPSDTSTVINRYTEIWDDGDTYFPGEDQRYFSRQTSDGNCDIGAFERYGVAF